MDEARQFNILIHFKKEYEVIDIKFQYRANAAGGRASTKSPGAPLVWRIANLRHQDNRDR
jgi:hypothetical protein